MLDAEKTEGCQATLVGRFAKLMTVIEETRTNLLTYTMTESYVHKEVCGMMYISITCHALSLQQLFSGNLVSEGCTGVAHNCVWRDARYR